MTLNDVSQHQAGGTWFSRGTLAALTAIVLLGFGLRVAYASTASSSAGWGVQVVSNANTAHNLVHGAGYHSTVSEELNRASDVAGSPLAWDEVLTYAPGPPERPIAYYSPGYPYLVAAVWKLTGQETYGAAQVFQALVDAAVGCLAAYLLLACSGRQRAGLLAAFGYAVAPPLLIQSALVLPDSLASAPSLAVLACVALGFASGRPLTGAAAAGLALGLAGWVRGDTLALLPFVVLAVLAVPSLSRQLRLRWAGLFLAAWIVPTLLLGLFYLRVYDEFHVTRPGTGILLWEAIGQQSNPWGIVAPPGRNLDAAAIELTRQRGLAYGSWEGDRLLRDEASAHMKARPGWFVAPTLRRLWRVATLQKPPEAATNLPDAVLRVNNLIGPLLPPAGALGLLLLRNTPLLRNLLLGAWLSRVLPFSFLRDELRFEILIVALYVVALAVLLDAGWQRMRPSAAG